MRQTRRNMLKTSLAVSAMSPFAPSFLELWQRAACAGQPARDDTILIVLQLSGGNDGLNTVVPYDNDIYARHRQTLRLKAADVLKIGETGFGFHPRMQGFQRLYDEGLLTILQGVGYPQSSRNHQDALRDWHTAEPNNTNPQTGWLGRIVDSMSPRADADIPAAFVSSIPTPLALTAAHAVIPTFASLDPFRNDVTELIPDSATSRQPSSIDNPLLNHVQRSTNAAATNLERLHQAASEAATRRSYPPLQLAQSLQTIAQLIRADLGIRIFMTELGGGGFGGFDNHANQRDNHAALLSQLSQSIAAFADDLKQDRLLDRVMLMTFSEFGRTVSENGRRGTGHGAAAPVFLVGGRGKGGLIGTFPSLDDLDQDAPKPHTDFRRVYATMLNRWLKIESEPILGKRFQSLDVLKTA